MQSPALPKRCREVCAIVPSDIHIFYSLTLAITKEVHNVKVFKVPADEVSDITSSPFATSFLVPRVLSYPPYGAREGRAGRREPWERGWSLYTERSNRLEVIV